MSKRRKVDPCMSSVIPSTQYCRNPDGFILEGPQRLSYHQTTAALQGPVLAVRMGTGAYLAKNVGAHHEQNPVVNIQRRVVTDLNFHDHSKCKSPHRILQEVVSIKQVLVNFYTSGNM